MGCHGDKVCVTCSFRDRSGGGKRGGGGPAGHMMLLGALKLFSPENCAAEEKDSFFLVQKNKRLSGHQMFRAEQTFY